jgi:hypothetical protein
VEKFESGHPASSTARARSGFHGICVKMGSSCDACMGPRSSLCPSFRFRMCRD